MKGERPEIEILHRKKKRKKQDDRKETETENGILRESKQTA